MLEVFGNFGKSRVVECVENIKMKVLIYHGGVLVSLKKKDLGNIFHARFASFGEDQNTILALQSMLGTLIS